MNSDDKKKIDPELVERLEEIKEELIDISECFHEATINSSAFLRKEALEKEKAENKEND